jgi:ribonuclease P protein component
MTRPGGWGTSMLPAQLRLKRRSEFGRVYTKGRSCATDLIVVYVLPGRTDGTKIGFSVGKKLGGAVARNRVRRVLQEAAAPFAANMKAGYSIVVAARTKAGEASFAAVSAALQAAFTKLGVLNAGNS